MRIHQFVELRANRLLPLFLFCGLAVGVAHPQSGQPQVEQRSPSQSPDDPAAELSRALARLKSGKDFGAYSAAVISKARAVEAIPGLEKQFVLVSDPLVKAKIAQVLLSFGVRKDIYWDYLEQLVKPVLESDAPDPVGRDDDQRREISQNFVDWARSRGLDPGEAAEKALYFWPGYFMLLGGTQDPRAVPLLRQAFNSPNSMVQVAASMGLAELQDKESIQMIIARCKAVQPNLASVIAESLVYFDDPEAQAAVDVYVPAEMAKVLRERKKAGKGALNGR